jgi:hypothetical protein
MSRSAAEQALFDAALFSCVRALGWRCCQGAVSEAAGCPPDCGCSKCLMALAELAWSTEDGSGNGSAQ